MFYRADPNSFRAQRRAARGVHHEIRPRRKNNAADAKHAPAVRVRRMNRDAPKRPRMNSHACQRERFCDGLLHEMRGPLN